MLILEEMTVDICSFVLFFVSAIIFSLIILALGYLLGERNYLHSKHIPFESGIDSIQSARLKFSVKFYLIALFFAIFDVEAIYLYAWSVVIREIGWIGFIEMLIFVIILLISLFYLINIKALHWVSKYN